MVDKADRVEVTAYGAEYVVDVTDVDESGFRGNFKNLTRGTSGHRGRFPWKNIIKFEVASKPIEFEDGDHLRMTRNIESSDVLFHDNKLWEVAKGLDVAYAAQQVEDGLVMVVRKGKVIVNG